jgi:hypothetical protein
VYSQKIIFVNKQSFGQYNKKSLVSKPKKLILANIIIALVNEKK